jgi:acetyltransferase-like isoleucine patch superfamily enzyme
MRNEQLIPRRTPASRAATDRVQVVMELTSRLNVLRHSDIEGRTALLSQILGRPMPETLTIYPPFYCDYGLNLEFGERIFVNQNCSFYDLGGISVGDRTMIGPGVTLSTAGHPVAPNERFDGITTAPIVIESNVWIGANATITPGVRVGSGSVVAAGAVVAKDVPPNCIVSSGGYVKRRTLDPAGDPSPITASKLAVAQATLGSPSADARVHLLARLSRAIAASPHIRQFQGQRGRLTAGRRAFDN